MNIVFLGPPGSGKGTQASQLAAENSLTHLSTGDVFRAALKSDSELGREIKLYIESGKLVPDDLVSAVVFEKLKEFGSEKGVILDGYPRTVTQAIALDNFSEKNNFKIDAVINFEVENEELFKRLSLRRQIENRVDDTDEIIKERLHVYELQTAPVLDHYNDRNNFISVNAANAVEEVHHDIVSQLQKIGTAVKFAG